MVLQVNYSRELSNLLPNQQSGVLRKCTVEIAYPSYPNSRSIQLRKAARTRVRTWSALRLEKRCHHSNATACPSLSGILRTSA
jgi:hypothetical protein